MKKLLTLLTLLACAVGGVKAEAEVIYSMTSVTGPTENLSNGVTADVSATFVGGAAQVYNGKSSAAALVDKNGINLGGSSASYFHATLTSDAIAEGDVITLSASGTLKISATASGATSVTFPYTIPSGSPLIGKKDVYLFKDGVSKFSSFIITRPAADDVANPTIAQSGNSISIACSTTGASIYYTVDGTEPTTSSSSYVAAFTLDNSCTVRAKAFKGDNASAIVGKDCYVSHSSAFAILGYNGGTLNEESNVWTSSDGQYILTDESEGRTIGYTNLAGSQDGFKINHTDTYTLQIPLDLKVTKIIVVGKSWLAGNAGNAATISFEGFTPVAGAFYDFVSESYVKTVEFTPDSERDYGATIAIKPGNNQLGAYIEIYGEMRQEPALPITGETITEVITFADKKVVSTVTPSTYSSVFGFEGTSFKTPGKDTPYASYTQGWEMGSNAYFTITLPENSSRGSITLFGTNGASTVKINDGSATSVSWTGNDASGYTLTFEIDDAYAGKAYKIGKGSGNSVIYQITITYTVGVEDGITLTTTTNMAGYRAFYDASQGYTVDENTTVYVASAKDDDAVTLSPIEGGIPAGTPVILKTTATDYTMTLTKATVDAYEGMNLLKASTAGQSLDVYRLGYGDDGVGFYNWTTSNAKAGIVYLEKTAAARSLKLVFGNGTTAIETVATQQNSGEVYNLQGQRMAQPTKGLFIVNGKKVLVK